MRGNDVNAESFLFMVLEVLSPYGNYCGMRVISATSKGKRIIIYLASNPSFYPLGNSSRSPLSSLDNAWAE